MQALRLFSYAVFLFVGCALVILRPSVMTWLLFGYCLAEAPVGAAYQALTAWPPLHIAALISVASPSAALGAVFLFLFALVVPDESVPRDWRGWVFWIAAIGTYRLRRGAFPLPRTRSRLFFSFGSVPSRSF